MHAGKLELLWAQLTCKLRPLIDRNGMLRELPSQQSRALLPMSCGFAEP